MIRGFAIATVVPREILVIGKWENEKMRTASYIDITVRTRAMDMDISRYRKANNNIIMMTNRVYMLLLGLTTNRAMVVMSFGTASKTRHHTSFTVRLHAGTQAASTTDERKPERDDFISRAFEEDAPLPSFQPFAANDSDYSRPFPMSLIIDEKEIKQALLLAACNPRMGGVIIYGRRGSGKSCLARSIHRLLPSQIKRVKHSPYNVDPGDQNAVDSLLEESLTKSGKSLQDLETEFIPTPFVNVPLNVMEDSLLGSVDLEASMESGKTVFSPGLLARAHRGILQVDDINLLDEETLHILFNVLTDGYVHVEREALSVKYPCRPLFLATYNPEEGELSEHLLDRIAISLPTAAEKMNTEERVRVVTNVEGYREKTLSLEAAGKEDERLHSVIEKGRRLLPKVEISHDQILFLCEEATGANCKGQRSEIFATEIAKTSAALNGRTKVEAGDMELGVLLAIAPRSRNLETVEETTEAEPSFVPAGDQTENIEREDNEPEEDSEGSPAAEPSFAPSGDQTENVEHEDNKQEEDSEESSEQQVEEEEVIEIPEQFMFGVDAAQIDPKILKFQKLSRKGKGGKAARMFNLKRGRFVKAIFPKGDSKRGHIAIGATLRAAAPFQIVRRRYAKEDKLVYIRNSDFRIKRMSKKAGCLVIFVVDSSGSMALNRMGAAKGAAMSLLKEAYKSRDKICLVSFHGDRAEIHVPPTKSMVLTKRRLEELPCGGGSPLAHALQTAARTGLNELKVKRDVGRVVIVLLTDGRANIPLAVSEGEHISDRDTKDRTFLKEEVISIAKRLGSLKDFNVVVIDTEDRFVGTGFARDIARASLGNYHTLVHGDLGSLSSIAVDAVKASRL
jgi:magnesium chelatase subunit D